MKNTLAVYDGVRDCLLRHINDYLNQNCPYDIIVPAIEDRNIQVDFPDLDKIPQNNMIYIIPDYFEITPQTVCTNLVTSAIKVYIFCKRDNHDNLIKRASTYFNAVCQTIMRYPTMDGAVNYAEMTSADYYPAVTASNTIAAYELNISLRYIFEN